MMETISGWDGLREYGINALTGEACAYGMRILCDVNEDGKQILESFFSMSVTSRNWNSTVNGKPAVGSVMLHRVMFEPLATFILLHVKKCYAVASGTWLFGITGMDREHYEKYKNQDGMRFFLNWSSGDSSVSRDGRNVHQISGRVN
jgi:hypothetical protein